MQIRSFTPIYLLITMQHVAWVQVFRRRVLDAASVWRSCLGRLPRAHFAKCLARLIDGENMEGNSQGSCGFECGTLDIQNACGGYQAY